MKNSAANTKLAYVITTYNRVADAKCQMDILREIWEPNFAGLDIYHAFNGKPNLYTGKYREDCLVRRPSKPHFKGAGDLIDNGVEAVLNSGKDYDYIAVASADVWFYNPKVINSLFNSAVSQNKDLIGSFWFSPMLSTEFFVIKPDLARKVFPLGVEQFFAQNMLAKAVDKVNSKVKFPVVELFFTLNVLKNDLLLNNLFLIPGRKFGFYTNRFYAHNFYASHHDQSQKVSLVREDLLKFLGTGIDDAPALAEVLKIK